MKTILHKTASYYNPMSINEKQFARIYIVDGDKKLFSFNWFTGFPNSSNATDKDIILNDKLVKSKLTKNKLRYIGKIGEYVLIIDKSLLNYSRIDKTTEVYEWNDTVIETYKLDGVEAYFTIRTQQDPNAKQLAYAELSDKVEKETRLTMYDIKRSLDFYNANKAMFKKAGL